MESFTSSRLVRSANCCAEMGRWGKEVVVEVPVFDEDSPFTGDYVSTADRAWKVVQDFVEGVEPRALGEWDRL